MKQNTLLAGALLLSALPTIALLPGCGGGNGGLFNPTPTPTSTTTATPTGTQETATPTGTSPTATPTGTIRPTATPTPTTRPTATPTATTRPTPTPTGTAATSNLVNATFTAQNGAYFGTSPYSATSDAISTEKQGTNGDLYIYSTTRDSFGARYLTLKLRSLGPVKDGQVFNLDGVGSWLVISGPPKDQSGTGEYNGYGGIALSSGRAVASRNGNVATFTFTNVVLKRSSGNTPDNSTITISGSARILLPPDAR